MYCRGEHGSFPLPQDSWREVVASAVRLGIPTPCFSCALAFFDGYRSDTNTAEHIPNVGFGPQLVQWVNGTY